MAVIFARALAGIGSLATAGYSGHYAAEIIESEPKKNHQISTGCAAATGILSTAADLGEGYEPLTTASLVKTAGMCVGAISAIKCSMEDNPAKKAKAAIQTIGGFAVAALAELSPELAGAAGKVYTLGSMTLHLGMFGIKKLYAGKTNEGYAALGAAGICLTAAGLVVYNALPALQKPITPQEVPVDTPQPCLVCNDNRWTNSTL
ncbi:MAG: hypothetical protein K1X28_00065 [Parachlamydiales bacterium]|nr:hypothetical protein [Parachlamydiales bacterium]